MFEAAEPKLKEALEKRDPNMLFTAIIQAQEDGMMRAAMPYFDDHSQVDRHLGRAKIPTAVDKIVESFLCPFLTPIIGIPTYNTLVNRI